MILISPSRADLFVKRLTKNPIDEQEIRLNISNIFRVGFDAGIEYMKQKYGEDYEYFVDEDLICVGKKVCENLAENLKAEFLGQQFDKYTEEELRKILTR